MDKSSGRAERPKNLTCRRITYLSVAKNKQAKLLYDNRIDGMQDLWEGEYTYSCILTNDYESSAKEIVKFCNFRGGKERIFDDMNNGFGWNRLPKSFMAESIVFLLLTALIRNFYKAIIQRLDVKKFGFNTTRIKAFVFRFISVTAKWIRTSRRNVLNIYTYNNAYAEVF